VLYHAPAAERRTSARCGLGGDGVPHRRSGHENRLDFRYRPVADMTWSAPLARTEVAYCLLQQNYRALALAVP